MLYTFDQIFAADPANPERVASNGVVTIFAPGDATQAPIAIKTVDGLAITNPVQVNDAGYGPAFTHDTLDRVAWSGGGFSGFFTSYDGIKNEAVAARVSAQEAATSAEKAAANTTAPTAEAVEREIVTQGAPARTAVELVAGQAATVAMEPKLDKMDAAITYTPLESFKEWSGSLQPAGGGIGGVKVGAGAARNIPDGSTAAGAQSFIAIGRDALRDATRARGCFAIGPGALGLGANPGVENLAIGTFALAHVQGKSEWYSDMDGSRNIGIGSLAGHFLTSGSQNTFLGRDSGHSVTTGSRNVGIGYRAVSCGFAPIGFSGAIENQYKSLGSANVGVGVAALSNNTGTGNTAVGDSAGTSARNASYNTFVGYGSGKLIGADVSENDKVLAYPGKTGTYTASAGKITVNITAHGAVAGNKVRLTLTSGPTVAITGEAQYVNVLSVTNANTFVIAGADGITGTGNVSLEFIETAESATVGSSLTAIGWAALGNTRKNAGNTTAIGEQAGLNSEGAYNTFIGSRSGFNLTTGAQNTFIGYNAGRASLNGGGMLAEDNVSAIGSGSGATASNQVQLGNSLTTTYVYGTVQNRSDARDKADIRDTKLGLDFIEKLRPVDYRWDMREDYTELDDEGSLTTLKKDGSKKRSRYHHGFIAQEVQQVIEETGEDFGGLQDHSVNGGADVLSIGYDEVIAPLVKAVQELTARVCELEAAR